ncbi:hypothetical protein NP233_g2994 [Leucocoprinus birnbaumii]|uniref:Uncharacterized protein n=1 Tax=Leucocoprinus birnbaumii TaxID=56174 RepID=A0AAD5VXD3_9AGAR|nr:hypothetical protein NP233_g2994 [Leucocoprinus birnbaumii]
MNLGLNLTTSTHEENDDQPGGFHVGSLDEYSASSSFCHGSGSSSTLSVITDYSIDCPLCHGAKSGSSLHSIESDQLVSGNADDSAHAEVQLLATSDDDISDSYSLIATSVDGGDSDFDLTSLDGTDTLFSTDNRSDDLVFGASSATIGDNSTCSTSENFPKVHDSGNPSTTAEGNEHPNSVDRSVEVSDPGPVTSAITEKTISPTLPPSPPSMAYPSHEVSLYTSKTYELSEISDPKTYRDARQSAYKRGRDLFIKDFGVKTVLYWERGY